MGAAADKILMQPMPLVGREGMDFGRTFDFAWEDLGRQSMIRATKGNSREEKY